MRQRAIPQLRSATLTTDSLLRPGGIAHPAGVRKTLKGARDRSPARPQTGYLRDIPMPARAMPAATLPVANATKRPGIGSELATPRRLTKTAAIPPSAPKAKYSHGCGSLGLGASTASPNQRCEPAQPTIKIANQSYIGTPSCFLAAFALGSLCSNLGIPLIGPKGGAEKEITTSFRHGQIVTPMSPSSVSWPSSYPVRYRGASVRKRIASPCAPHPKQW